MMQNKIILWVIGVGVLLVVAVFAGGYFLTKTPKANTEIGIAPPHETSVDKTHTETVLIHKVDFNGCSEDAIVFSPRGNRVAYERCGKDGVESVIDMGNAIPVNALSINGFLRVSSDGNRLAYVVHRQIVQDVVDKDGYMSGGKYQQFVIDNGKEGKGYDGINGYGLTFSQSAKSLAYSVNGEAGSFVVVNNTEGKHYEKVSDPLFSPNTEEVVYFAKQEGKWFLISGEREEEAFNNPESLTISKNGEVVAYIAGENGKSFVVVDNKKDERSMTGGEIGNLQLTNDGKGIVYTIKKSGKMHIVFNGQAGADYDLIRKITLSSDGRRCAYFAGPYATNGNKTLFFVVDGKELKKLKNATPFEVIFSPDGKNVAYSYVLKQDNKFFSRVVVNDIEQKLYEGGIFGLSFTPDSQNIVYPASEGGKSMIVVGTKEYGRYDRVWVPLISSDGGYVSYGAQKGDVLIGVTEQIK